jgi:hypothetical protein
MKDETSTFLKLSTNEKEIYGNAILKAFDKIHNWDFSLNLFRCAIKILFVHDENPYSVYQDEKFMKIFTKYSFQLFTNKSVENYMKSMKKPHFLYIAFFTPSFIRISNKEQDLMFSSFQLDTMLFFLKNLVVQRIDKKHSYYATYSSTLDYFQENRQNMTSLLNCLEELFVLNLASKKDHERDQIDRLVCWRELSAFILVNENMVKLLTKIGRDHSLFWSIMFTVIKINILSRVSINKIEWQNLNKDNEGEEKANLDNKLELIFKIIRDLLKCSFNDKDFNLKMLSEIFDFGSLLDTEYSNKFESFCISQCMEELGHEKAEDLIRKYEFISNLKSDHKYNSKMEDFLFDLLIAKIDKMSSYELKKLSSNTHKFGKLIAVKVFIKEWPYNVSLNEKLNYIFDNLAYLRMTLLI